MINLRKLFASFNILRLTVDHYYLLPPLVVLKGYYTIQTIGLPQKRIVQNNLSLIPGETILGQTFLTNSGLPSPFLLRTGGLTQKSGIVEAKLDRVKYGGLRSFIEKACK
jgi:hypothetical protein